MRFIHLLKKHLLFTKRERQAFLTLNTLLVAAMIFHGWAHYFNPPALFPPPQMIVHESSGPTKHDTLPSNLSFRFEPFNPNAVSKSELLEFGISEKAADNLIKFRSAGGAFREADDIFKLYSWSEEEKDAAWPFIVLPNSTVDKYSGNKKEQAADSPVNLFDFDPNTANRDEWIALGIPAYLADRIGRYLDAGGSFQSPEDVKKIYGFKDSDYERLHPYIKIQHTTAALQQPEPKETAKMEMTGLAKGAIPVNTATVDALIDCGLPKAAAWKVVNYRDKLGGFYSSAQLNEIKDLENDALKQLLTCVHIDSDAIKKLRINSADFTDLANHPYLSNNLARAIIQYRDSTGYYRSVDEIARAYRISPTYLKKLKNYLSL